MFEFVIAVIAFSSAAIFFAHLVDGYLVDRGQGAKRSRVTAPAA